MNNKTCIFKREHRDFADEYVETVYKTGLETPTCSYADIKTLLD